MPQEPRQFRNQILNHESHFCVLLQPVGYGDGVHLWESRGFAGFMLGLAVPMCVLSAWLLEHKPMRWRAAYYQIAGYAGMFFGVIAILIFISSISTALASGLGFGFILSTIGIQILGDRPPK